ncbi:peptide/nickel transport system permease protein [Thermocatellispora tengchongensis]|uniref:Peptide/nickel transport system permease protein n=1 Tax=Thermocatellispora tengchongensis TaxID=1073253 RepID=A0A840PDG4_9ACTN|nr:ABC transporter permease [Thermocatellispora tengchongensis]MBB5135460.1 peptide/nickel transport system permease protein [Thermocatellispora tengchongensis]
MRWVAFLARRIAGAAAVLAILSGLIFAATEALPGDAAGVLAGADASAAERAQLRADLELDRPPLERYGDWIAGAVAGDLGVSLVGRRDVDAVLFDRLPNSLLLTALALGAAVPAAIALGLAAGLREGRPADRMVSSAALVLVSLPEFLTVTLLIAVFGTWLGLLPEVSLTPLGGRPWDTPQAMVLPVLSLAVVGLAVMTRLVRSSVAEAAASPYAEAARLAGVRGVRLALRHILPNALGPVVQVFAVMFGGLLGGAVVVETIFNYPGVGFELQQAVANRDVPMVQGLALALAALALAVLLLGDIVGTLVNPRLRSAP